MVWCRLGHNLVNHNGKYAVRRMKCAVYATAHSYGLIFVCDSMNRVRWFWRRLGHNSVNHSGKYAVRRMKYAVYVTAHSLYYVYRNTLCLLHNYCPACKSVHDKGRSWVCQTAFFYWSQNAGWYRMIPEKRIKIPIGKWPSPVFARFLAANQLRVFLGYLSFKK